jgi:hypothetical protein
VGKEIKTSHIKTIHKLEGIILIIII